MAREEERIKWKFLGRVIGTATGWDQTSDESFCLYDFEPAADFTFPASKCLDIDYTNGKFVSYDDDGVVLRSADILGLMKDVVR